MVTLNDYLLVTATASYDVTNQIQIFGRIENLLDEQYQEIFSYNTIGIGVYMGLRVRLGG
ncbi:MAG: hypothetical protein CMG46_11870 [Candidatus Marinimicrobia bacterium]|nr:hypothetical protein [Candidatus Neomarinimicrobiota bacterium]